MAAAWAENGVWAIVLLQQKSSLPLPSLERRVGSRSGTHKFKKKTFFPWGGGTTFDDDGRKEGRKGLVGRGRERERAGNASLHPVPSFPWTSLSLSLSLSPTLLKSCYCVVKTVRERIVGGLGWLQMLPVEKRERERERRGWACHR